MIDSEPINSLDKSISIKHIKYLDNIFVASNNYDISHIKTLKDLEDVPVILPIKGTANRNNLDEYLVKNNCILNNILNIHTSEVIIGAIKRNLGIGYIIKEMVIDDINNGILKEIPINNLPKTGISLVYVKEYITESPKIFLNKYFNIDI
jgi:DNA-binding transcriptional LysR family regulator